MADILTLAELVDELTNPMQVREPYDIWDGNRNRKKRWHTHRMPSLLEQLHTAAIPGEVYVEDNGHTHRTPSSCPPARIDAINLSLSIDVGAANWVWRTRQTIREDTSANLRQLVGAQVDSDTRTLIQRDITRWLHAARIVAGWERAPYRPPAPCPLCDQHGLRVRLEKSTAVCVDCHETWDDTTIGLLAEHVKQHTERVTGQTLDAATR